MISSKLNEFNLAELASRCPDRLQAIFREYLHPVKALELKSAINYTLEKGGKRLRPLLIYATGLMFDAPWINMDLPACAVELIHTYSLIHDDLPCMDNADLRRGQPTCHKIFSEGMAVLTGDALHTLAIQILSCHPAQLSDSNRVAMIATLTKACGPYGMAAGQALDITVMNDIGISKSLLEEIYHLKTGRLFTACLELGRLSANNDNELHQAVLRQFGDDIGLAFQIQDDILDIETSTELLGKPQGGDHKNNKLTYPKLYGLKDAKEKVDMLYNRALDRLRIFGNSADILSELIQTMLLRKK